jgi:hypothetical protein
VSARGVYAALFYEGPAVAADPVARRRPAPWAPAPRGGCARRGPLKDGIGDCRIDDHLVPVIDGELTGHNRRAAAVAIVDDFEQVAALLRGQRSQPPVIEDAGIPLCRFRPIADSHSGAFAGRELGEQRLVETARRLGVEILDGGGLPEVGAVGAGPRGFGSRARGLTE